jgi:predicted nucleotide-binding protein
VANELDDVRARLMKKLDIGTRQLNRLIQQREGETLLPRRLAILSLAADNGVSVRRAATEDDLAQLRAVKQGVAAPTQPPGSASPVAATRKTSATKATKKAPGRPAKRAAAKPRPKAATRGRKVFVVHGRNDRLRRDMFSFLRSLGLEPLEWRKAIAATGQGSPSVPDILDAAFSEAIAIVVLLTPDDWVMLAEPYQRSTDPSYEKRLVGQARPNVLFEAGMAFGREPNSTILVQVGEVKPFSDVGGRHLAYLGNDPESRAELVTKLRNAGCAVDDEGSDWYTTGDFTPDDVSAPAGIVRVATPQDAPRVATAKVTRDPGRHRRPRRFST